MLTAVFQQTRRKSESHVRIRVIYYHQTRSKMSILFSGTSPEIEEFLIQKLRQTPPWRKMEMLAELNKSARLLSLAGLQQRYPNATEQELTRHLANLWLGADLANQIYGYSEG